MVNAKRLFACTVFSRKRGQLTTMATYAKPRATPPEVRDYVWLVEQLEDYLCDQGISQQQVNAYVLARLLSSDSCATNTDKENTDER